MDNCVRMAVCICRRDCEFLCISVESIYSVNVVCACVCVVFIHTLFESLMLCKRELFGHDRVI